MTHSLIFFYLGLNLVNPVFLYIILSTWPVSCHIFVKWPIGQKQLDHAGLYISLISCNVTTMVTNQPKRYLSVTLSLCDFVPVLNVWVRKSFDLPELTKPTM